MTHQEDRNGAVAIPAVAAAALYCRPHAGEDAFASWRNLERPVVASAQDAPREAGLVARPTDATAD